MASKERVTTRRQPPDAKKNQRALLVVVLASSLASAAAIIWFGTGGRGTTRGRIVDPEHPSADVQDMAEAAESFVLFWSTFRYEEATHVSTGDSLARVRLAMDKELDLSPAERQLASELRKSVADLAVEVVPSEVVDEDESHKILRATTTVRASDRTVRRQQEFHLVRMRGNWKVAAWDPGEPEGTEGAAEPGLQIPDDLRDLVDAGPDRGGAR